MSPSNEVFLFDEKSKHCIKPKKYHVSDSPIFAQSLVVNGLGLGLFLPATLRAELDSGLLVPILSKLLGESLTITLLYPSRKHVPIRVRALIDYLRNINMFA